MGQTTRSRSQTQKCWNLRKGFVTKNTHVKYQSSSTHNSKVISKVKVLKNGSNSKAKVTGSKIRVSTERSYQSFCTHCSKIISKVKVFKIWVKLPGQCHRVKNNGTHWKVLSQGILMWNIKALALTVQKLLARLKISKNG